jgi:hypothetical protein
MGARRVGEVRAPLQWRKARASANGGGNCVEVAVAGHAVRMRDSKDLGGSVLAFTVQQWAAFTRAVRDPGDGCP